MLVEKFLTIDCETGGIPKETSLLTSFYGVYDLAGNMLDSLYLYTKPNDGVYKVEAGGLAVNKIDLIQHDKVATTYSDAGNELRRFLLKNSDNGKIKLTPVGKNVPFDIERINSNILGAKTWNMYVSYRVVEVTSIAILAQQLSLIPKDMSLSLGSLIEFLGIKVEGCAHEAKYDAIATMLTYFAIYNLIQSKLKV